MNQTPLLIILALLIVLVAVFAYNMIQESRYRNKIRSQFGHADQDALMGSQTQSVRDGHSFSHEKISGSLPPKLKPSFSSGKYKLANESYADESITLDFQEPPKSDKKQDKKSAPAPVQTDDDDINLLGDIAEPDDIPTQEKDKLPAPNGSFMSGIRATFNKMLNSINDDPEQPETPPTRQDKLEVYQEDSLPPEHDLLIELEELKRRHLTWFDSRVDYMAYVSLRKPQELSTLPRLSNRYRFQMVGCTMDGLFQVAEPIPGVAYQAFVIGLQAINRNGLASERDLDMFGQQVEHFAEKLGGDAMLDNIHAFRTIAEPIDELCARVDQTIAIHLVSRVSILGSELRNSLEKLGFQLMQDGSFGYMANNGDLKFSAVTLDGSSFTPQLLASQPYKGFSMLFDITRVPQGEHHFDEFMNLAVALSQNLHLELVDDQIQQLSKEWLKEVRHYVLSRQMEMLDANIEPGGELAQRLFA